MNLHGLTFRGLIRFTERNLLSDGALRRKIEQEYRRRFDLWRAHYMRYSRMVRRRMEAAA
jgi:hypothetical protein